jgi:hypothetical protein
VAELEAAVAVAEERAAEAAALKEQLAAMEARQAGAQAGEWLLKCLGTVYITHFMCIFWHYPAPRCPRVSGAEHKSELENHMKECG